MHKEINQKRISFIIVNYQSTDMLQDCVKSIKQVISDQWLYEIIIVNNDPQKITPEISHTVDHIIELEKNYGYGYANNRGSEIANGEIICFLNPDAVFLSSSIATIFVQFDDDAVGIVAPRLVTHSGRTQEWSTGVEMTLRELVRSHVGISRSARLWQARNNTRVAWVSGAAMFIRTTLLCDLHGFDENFFLYYEDIDLCRRAREIGMRTIYCPYVEVQHVSGASSCDQTQQKKLYYRSQDYYFKKHFHPFIGYVVRMLRVPYRFIK